MQHGALTPLGTQLRQVLARLSRPTTLTPNRSSTHPNPRPRLRAEGHIGCHNAVRNLNTTSVTKTQAAAVSEPVDERTRDDERVRFEPFACRKVRYVQGLQKPYVDHLTHALRDAGRHAALPPTPPKHTIDLTFVDIENADGHRDDRARRLSPQLTTHPGGPELSLKRILASLIRHRAGEATQLEANWEAPPVFTEKEQAFLRSKRVSFQDLEAWADIVSNEDGLSAAQTLAARTEALGVGSVPIFIYTYLLRREYLSARALRILLKSVSDLFRHRLHTLHDPSKDELPLFITIVRLIRYAREVWPQALPNIAELWLTHLQTREQRSDPFENDQLAHITYLSNKLMSLLSISTAVHPFRDVVHQEAAIVPIIRYMAEHQPPLHINRQGYRAVVRVQLAERKTSTERKWAELKSLAWPPWKVDRTAMDTLIGPEDGISKAGATLVRMREAGYRPLKWEKTAELYTGWDTDRTPTVQMRVLLGSPGMRMSKVDKHAVSSWAARIDSTRTVQEAWACYLAWQDQGLPHGSDVYLAIFNKLYEEEQRQRRKGNERLSSDPEASWDLLPGDAREISPLPPSTHLYTYTRTRPPTLGDFYRSLLDRNVILNDHCVAFVVRHARTLQEGLERLQNACAQYPAIQDLLFLRHSDHHSQLPKVILVAAVDMHARFANTYLPISLRQKFQRPQTSATHEWTLRTDNTMARAIDIIQMWPIPYRPLWNAVFEGLTRRLQFLGIGKAILNEDHDEYGEPQRYSTLPKDLQHCAGALAAFRLMRKLLAVYREGNLDLDETGFMHFCVATENFVIGAWTVLLYDPAGFSQETKRAFMKLTHDAAAKTKAHRTRLKGEFRILVGQDHVVNASLPREMLQDKANVETSKPKQNRHVSVELPTLLTVPSPAILHAYIRALGWLADYDELLELVCWMREHRVLLADVARQDRLGKQMMRKAIVALRVFLERSWQTGGLKEVTPSPDAFWTGRHISSLRKLSSPADSWLVKEVKGVVEDFGEWGGWATDEEVTVYASDKRFGPFR